MVSFKFILIIQIKFQAYVARAGYSLFPIGKRHKWNTIANVNSRRE